MTPEEYLKLIEQFADDRYGDDSEESSTIPETAWMPSVSPAKEKMLKALDSNKYNVCIDLTNAKKDKIKDSLYESASIKVGSYLIKIMKYHGQPDVSGSNLTMDIRVWEQQNKTPSGFPSRMTYSVNFHKDNRFDKRPWLSNFDTDGRAMRMPVDTVVDVIRWLQAIKRVSAFF